MERATHHLEAQRRTNDDDDSEQRPLSQIFWLLAIARVCDYSQTWICGWYVEVPRDQFKGLVDLPELLSSGVFLHVEHPMPATFQKLPELGRSVSNTIL